VNSYQVTSEKLTEAYKSGITGAIMSNGKLSNISFFLLALTGPSSTCLITDYWTFCNMHIQPKDAFIE